jgi:hypothetical protein
MNIDLKKITEFWNWFRKKRAALEKMLDAGDVSSLAKEMNPHVRSLHDGLRWEIGAGKQKNYALAITCGGDRELRAETNRIVELAPSEPDWEFYPSRQPHSVPPTVELVNKGINVSTRGWKFSPKENLDAKRVDITVIDKQLSQMSKNDALTAVFIFLDASLGEDPVEEWIGDIQVSSEEGDLTPIHKMSEIQNYMNDLRSRYQRLILKI